jgi:energy-coupling factor transport system ATP-binding protein
MPIELANVSCSYRSNTDELIPALQDVSLNVGDGEFVGIMGHTGCGKTTLIHIMSGLLAPDSGMVLLDEQDINSDTYDRNELRGKVGVVFQFPDYQLFESTVEKDVAFGLKHKRLDHEETEARVRWALETVGLPYQEVRSRSPFSLSGGEKRRLAIAGAIVTKPRFLMLDEPIAGLDPQCCQSFMRTLASMNCDGTTIVMVSHNADVMGEYAKRLLVLQDGSLALEGTVQDVFFFFLRLRGLHINAGAPRAIGNMLARRGFNVPHTVTSYKELLYALKSIL